MLRSAFHAGLLGAAVCALATPTADAKIRATSIATFDGTVELTASGGRYALMTRDGRGQPQVLIGQGTDAPSEAEGIGAGLQGPVHFGTSASGATVLTYPRCADGQRARCDLYAWDLATHRETPVDGVNGARTAEVEGVMRRGAVAFTRETGARSALLFRPARGRARTLARQGGEGLALGASGVLQVIDPPRTVAGARRPTLLQRVSLTGKVAVLRRQGVGEDQQRLVAPTFLAGGVQYSLSALSGTTLFREDRRGAVQQARTGKVETDLSFVSSTRAYALRLDYRKDPDSPTTTLVRLDGIAFKTTR